MRAAMKFAMRLTFASEVSKCRYLPRWGGAIGAWLLSAALATAQEGPVAQMASREPTPSLGSGLGDGGLSAGSRGADSLRLNSANASNDAMVEDEAEGTWWNGWKPSIPKLTPPKLTPPKLTMPQMEMPKPMEWAKKVNQGTRQVVGKTKDTLTAPFQAWSNPEPKPKKNSTSEKPGFWSRMFTAEEDVPEEPKTVADFLKQPRVSSAD